MHTLVMLCVELNDYDNDFLMIRDQPDFGKIRQLGDTRYVSVHINRCYNHAFWDYKFHVIYLFQFFKHAVL